MPQKLVTKTKVVLVADEAKKTVQAQPLPQVDGKLAKQTKPSIMPTKPLVLSPQINTEEEATNQDNDSLQTETRVARHQQSQQPA